MTPGLVAFALRRIAKKIRTSARPRPDLVKRDLRVVLSVITNRLQTSGASDPTMAEIYEDESLSTKIQAFLEGFNSSFGTEFEVSDAQLEDRGVGYLVIQYPDPKSEPQTFKMDWDPTESYSAFIQKLMQEIFGTELPAMISESAPEEEEVDEGQVQGQGGQAPGQGGQAAPLPSGGMQQQQGE